MNSKPFENRELIEHSGLTELDRTQQKVHSKSTSPSRLVHESLFIQVEIYIPDFNEVVVAGSLKLAPPLTVDAEKHLLQDVDFLNHLQFFEFH